MSKSPHTWHRKRRGLRITQLLARDGTVCSLCTGSLDRHIKDPHHPMYITFDHVIPRSKGGLDTLENLRLAHQQCNVARGNDPILPADEEAEAA